VPAAPNPRTALTALTVLARAGLLRPPRPDHALGMAAALGLWGLSPAGGYAAHAARHSRRVALVDPAGSLTYGEVDRLTTDIAAGLRAAGLAEGDAVGVLCVNDRSFVLSVVALGKVGATIVLLNTGSSVAALAAIAQDEGLVAVVHDPSLTPPAGVAAYDASSLPSVPGAPLVAPGEPGRFVILTSGTTGHPKGARRAPPGSLDPMVALLSVIPLKAGESTVVAAPLFHAWGFAHWLLGVALGSTLVLTGPFDAPSVLAAVQSNGATALVAVPVMLRRLLDVEDAYDTSSLRVVAVSGSALPPDLAAKFMDRFGDVLYDLYGSTEVAWASIATPADLREAPGSVGRPPFGTEVRLVDAGDDGVGRIFVGNGLLIEGYTGGGGKEVRDGLMATGDLGRWDDEGRLYVVGREDDMVVSGGENVFPGPVEDVVAALPGVADVAVVGVDDEEFGQRLRAVVVLASGATLSADEVKARVREALGRHYVPRDVTFADTLPRNAAGKVVKRDL
jgi:fatty-acyl-CoA synthase